MIRFAGAALIIMSCAYFGIMTSRFFTARAEILEAFVKLVSYIDTEIGGFLIPLNKIFSSFRSPILEKTGFCDVLIKKGGIAAVEECKCSLCLFEPERALIKEFFKELGHHDAEGEARYCDYYKTKLTELAVAARSNATSKKQLYTSLFLLFGIMLSVILI